MNYLCLTLKATGLKALIIPVKAESLHSLDITELVIRILLYLKPQTI